MTRPDDLPKGNERRDAYDDFWTASEADLDIPLPAPAPPPVPDDTYAAFRQAADE